jgi:hypothetical protein
MSSENNPMINFLNFREVIGLLTFWLKKQKFLFVQWGIRMKLSENEVKVLC